MERRAVDVTFREEAATPVLVPERMWEWYEMPVSGSDKTYIECLARYTNLRRFTVTTTEQVKPQ